MESVSRDLNQQMERLAAFEFIQAMALDRKDRSAADWLAVGGGFREKVSSPRTRTLCFFIPMHGMKQRTRLVKNLE
jgi:hypothetical protein